MNKRIWGALLIGFPLLFSSSAIAADAMKPGLWEITTSVEMPGMPYQAPAQTMRHCYTAEEVKENPVPKDENCKLIDLKSFGNKTSWKVECTGEAAAKGEGEMIFHSDAAYEGKTRMETQGMLMTMKYKGKRIGDCK